MRRFPRTIGSMERTSSPLQMRERVRRCFQTGGIRAAETVTIISSVTYSESGSIFLTCLLSGNLIWPMDFRHPRSRDVFQAPWRR